MKAIVAQIGAREHYAVARALHQQGMLAGLVTDWYAPAGPLGTVLRWSAGMDGGGICRAALGARSDALPAELVRAFPLRSLLWKRRVRRLAARGRGHEAYVQTDRAFSSAVARLKLPSHDVFFGCSYASLEMLEVEKRRGVLTVLDQIDPGAMEFKLVAEEMRRHPHLAGVPRDFPAAYYERNRREWDLADIILVNSEWSRKALIHQGVPPGKLVVIPLAYEAEQMDQSPHHRPSDSAMLRVLWLGQVNVRKGIHYLIEAARMMEGESVLFDVVGPIAISQTAVNSAPPNMRFHGRVTRDAAAQWYRQSDVFVIPTLSDGFALTQLEAMAHGLPVIATPHCGSVVTDGLDGFIIEPQDPSGLSCAIQLYAHNRNLLNAHRLAAPRKCAQFTVSKLAERLRAALFQAV